MAAVFMSDRTAQMRLAPMFAFAVMATPLWAAGFNDDTPPTPTETTTACAEGLVWDEEAESCVAPKESRLGDDGLYRAVRELAYAGRYDGAKAALAAMSDQNDTRVLTYRGFLARKTGDFAAAEAFYTAALAVDPDNLLARSYYGQGLVERGAYEAARAELSEIRRRGGRNTWAEAALGLALASGTGPAY
ncbi:MAG: tetratricopeptide repeat protein [Pseudomonadota bacterium]